MMIRKDKQALVKVSTVDIGPMKGVFPTPDTGPFLKATLNIEAKIKPDTLHSNSQFDTRHCQISEVDIRQSDSPSWALDMVEECLHRT